MLESMIRNKNYKYIYAESTSFKSLTSIHCHQNKYLKKEKIKLLNSGGKKYDKEWGEQTKKRNKEKWTTSPKGFLQTGIQIRGTDTHLSRNATNELIENDEKSVINQKWQPSPKAS